MELEDEERRREKRRLLQLSNAQKNEARTATNPLSPTTPASTDAIDDLLKKLREQAPSSRDKRDARRRARVRHNGTTMRAVSLTKNEPLADDAGSDDGKPKDSADCSDATATAATASGSDKAAAAPSILDESDLTNRTQEMLMRLRGDGPEAGGFDASKFRLRPEDTRRKERRRRQGSKVQVNGLGLQLGASDPSSSAAASTESLGSAGPDSASLNSAGFSSADGDDPVARAKSALMAMRRGSDVGSDAGTAAAEKKEDDTDKGKEVDSRPEPDILSPDIPTPTTIVSPPSPEPPGDD